MKSQAAACGNKSLKIVFEVLIRPEPELELLQLELNYVLGLGGRTLELA